MTKQEYLVLLQEKLEIFGRELQREIMEDYEEHFAEGLAAGKTEEEIVEELGDIEDMIRELPEDEVDLQRPAVTERNLAETPEEKTNDLSYRYSCQEKKYQAIVIDGLAADVTLEKSEDDSIFVHYESDVEEDEPSKYRFCQFEKDGVLHLEVKMVDALHLDIKERDGFQGKSGVRDRKIMVFGKTIVRFMNSGGSEEIRLSVKVPDGIPRIDLRTVSGDAAISGIRTEQLSVVTTSGDLKLLRNKVDEANVRTTSGDVEAKETACNRFHINTSSGDVEADSVAAVEMAVQTGSGDVRLGKAALGNLQVSTGSGDIMETGEVRNRTIVAGSGDIVITPAGNADSIKVRTGSGDVILNMDAISGVKATVGTGSGDGVIRDRDGEHYVSRGECTVGEGPCRVVVTTGSGDAIVKLRETN